MTAHAPARIQLADAVPLGFAVGTGEAVAVPVGHLAVTGQTQASGKTTTLEALVARSGLRAVAFVTKRHEASFRGEHHRVPPYFRERADWQFVQSVLEATMREKMRFERAWIMRACKGAKTLADVHRNVRRLMDKAKGLSADVYLTLDHYLDVVVPQIASLEARFGGEALSLVTGLNVMDLSGYTTELQSLVIRSVIEWVYEHGRDVLVIIPEAWEFIPQARGSPVLLACEQLIRKGGAGGNFVWLDSQDIAGVHKNVLRSVGVWILGVQREANEVKRVLAHIPGKKPGIDDVMQLERGQFFVCYGRTVIKTYVQPSWMSESLARLIAVGKAKPPAAPDERNIKEEMMDAYQYGTVPEREGRAVKEEEAIALRTENAKLKGEVSRLELMVDELRGELRDLRDTFDPPDPPPAWDGKMPPADAPPRAADPPPQSSPGDIDWIYACVKKRALEDSDPKMIALFTSHPEIEVTKTIERIRLDTKKQPGFLAAMIVEGFFKSPIDAGTVVDELKRRGRSVHHTNVYRDLNRLAEMGFLTKEGDGYQAVEGMKVNIIEA